MLARQPACTSENDPPPPETSAEKPQGADPPSPFHLATEKSSVLRAAAGRSLKATFRRGCSTVRKGPRRTTQQFVLARQPACTSQKTILPTSKPRRRSRKAPTPPSSFHLATEKSSVLRAAAGRSLKATFRRGCSTVSKGPRRDNTAVRVGSPACVHLRKRSSPTRNLGGEAARRRPAITISPCH